MYFIYLDLASECVSGFERFVPARAVSKRAHWLGHPQDRDTKERIEARENTYCM